MLDFTKKIFNKSSLGANEIHASRYLPYLFHLDDQTILLKDGSLLQTIKLSGYSFETADDEDVDIQKSIRNKLLRSMASASCSVYIHTLRKKQNIFDGDFGSVKTENKFTKTLAKQWKEKNSKKQHFVNEIYITIITQQSGKKIKGIFDKFKLTKSSDEAKESSVKDSVDEISEITSRVSSGLRQYLPKILSIKKNKHGVFSEALTFLNKIINFGGKFVNTPIIVPSISISEYITSNRVCFKNRYIEMLTPFGMKYGTIVSLKEYGQTTSAGMLDNFLQLPNEILITQTFEFINRQVAVNKMQIQQNRMIQSSDKAISQIAEITAALDNAMSGSVAFGNHSLTVMCIEDSIKNIDMATSLVETELGNAGLFPVREKINLEPAYWSQFPGNKSFMIRKGIISSLNLASLSSLHNYPQGSKYNNHWGEAVTVFDTTSSTPFFFNFHVRDVGHTTVIGPTGSGKTVLLNFLCAQSIKFKPRIFFFDKDNGAEIFIRAINGQYSIIEPQRKSNLNPLQLDDTPENRRFLQDWLETLVTIQGDIKLSPEEISVVSQAVQGNFKLKKEDRVLKNLAPFFGVGGPGTLANRLEMWHSEGSHATIFDNDEDCINFSDSSVFGFEMGKLLQDKYSLAPVLLYLFHRISISLDGHPSMIVLDEAWALIDNPIFAPKIKDWLKVLRKLNTFVVFATQSVEDASKSKISDTLIQQTATQIFLPNLKATSAYRETFMLSQREFTLIKHTEPSSRFFLIKQDSRAVVARIDLNGMDDIINVLSGRSETVGLMNKIISEVGKDPNDWLPIFVEKVQDV